MRLPALHALVVILRATWPRVHAHAAVVWGVLMRVYTDEMRLVKEPSVEVMDVLKTAGKIVWKVADEEFREETRKRCSLNADDECMFLKSITM